MMLLPLVCTSPFLVRIQSYSFARLPLTVPAAVIVLDQNDAADRVVGVSREEVLARAEQAGANLATIKKAKGRARAATGRQ